MTLRCPASLPRVYHGAKTSRSEQGSSYKKNKIMQGIVGRQMHNLPCKFRLAGLSEVHCLSCFWVGSVPGGRGGGAERHWRGNEKYCKRPKQSAMSPRSRQLATAKEIFPGSSLKTSIISTALALSPMCLLFGLLQRLQNVHFPQKTGFALAPQIKGALGRGKNLNSH